MRDTNEGMIELIDATFFNGNYSCLIHHQISNEFLKLRFQIEQTDYIYLKRILEAKPFENKGVANYRYFFASSYRKDSENDNLAHIAIRVEQINRHKQYEFSISRKFIANLLWFYSLTDKLQIEKMIEK